MFTILEHQSFLETMYQTFRCGKYFAEWAGKWTLNLERILEAPKCKKYIARYFEKIEVAKN